MISRQTSFPMRPATIMELKEYADRVSKKILEKSLIVGVVGLGYVGLPTAVALHKSNFRVWGIDVSDRVINSLKNNKSHLFEGDSIKIPNDDRWNVTTSYEEAIPYCDIVLVCVPTPVDDSLMPDLSMVRESFFSISNNMGKSQNIIIILESTVQPGTTNSCYDEILMKNPKLGDKIRVGYCPERISPGENNFGVSQVARVIGSNDIALTKSIAKLYSNITSGEILPVSSIEVAEASKLVENSQRDIDIAFANELSILMPKIGLDVEEVLAAASTKWNFHRHTPGIGVGGHCIPIDPHYYINLAKQNDMTSALSPAARELNSSMPKYVAKEILSFCPEENLNILILGYSYKPNIGDSRETPVKSLIEDLVKNSNNIYVWDPLLKNEEFPENSIVIDSPYELENLDCIVVATAHDEIISLDWDKLIKIMNNPKIYDGRRCLDKNEMIEKGWQFNAIGLPIRPS
jgi:UDP-N-acetyl-D-galactosamine dehydrogenase